MLVFHGERRLEAARHHWTLVLQVTRHITALIGKGEEDNLHSLVQEYNPREVVSGCTMSARTPTGTEKRSGVPSVGCAKVFPSAVATASFVIHGTWDC